MLVSRNGGIDTTVILSRPSTPLRSAQRRSGQAADDEGSQVAASVDLEILPLRFAQGQDDVLRRYRFDRYTTRVRRWMAAAFCIVIAGACRKQQPLSQNLNVENKVAMRTVLLYYESQDLLLAPERRELPLPENPAGAIDLVLQELVKGSANAAVPRLLPGDTVVRAAYLLPDGTAFVDFGGPTLTQGWATGSHQELMAVYSVVQTVTANFPEARRVRVLINGEPAETLGGHVSLARALSPMPSIVAR